MTYELKDASKNTKAKTYGKKMIEKLMGRLLERTIKWKKIAPMVACEWRITFPHQLPRCLLRSQLTTCDGKSPTPLTKDRSSFSLFFSGKG